MIRLELRRPLRRERGLGSINGHDPACQQREGRRCEAVGMTVSEDGLPLNI